MKKKSGKLPKVGKRSVSDGRDFSFSETLALEVHRFVEYHQARRVSRNLRNMLLEFLLCDAAIESTYLKDLITDLEALFDLLEAIQNDQEKLTASGKGEFKDVSGYFSDFGKSKLNNSLG